MYVPGVKIFEMMYEQCGVYGVGKLTNKVKANTASKPNLCYNKAHMVC